MEPRELKKNDESGGLEIHLDLEISSDLEAFEDDLERIKGGGRTKTGGRGEGSRI